MGPALEKFAPPTRFWMRVYALRRQGAQQVELALDATKRTTIDRCQCSGPGSQATRGRIQKGQLKETSSRRHLMMQTMERASTEQRETSSLIGSDKVEGTALYDAQGKRIGKVERLMIDKRGGQVAYAVLSFGGFLGIGANHYPIPWSMLNYNEELGGYQVDLTEEQLKSAPKIEQGENWEQSDRDQEVYDYWQVRYFWLAD
jgi:sporulation protein YlmC with PRC-barrel domain